MKENPMRLARRWVDGRFNFRSGYYAGRGPNSGDLNYKILGMIYQGLKRDVSTEAATNFVRFVNKLTDLSASAFIVAFEWFCAHDCNEIAFEQHKSDGQRIDGRGKGLEMEAFGLIAETLFGRETSDEENLSTSRAIKQQFILFHKNEIPKEELQEERSPYDRRFTFFGDDLHRW